MSTYALHYGHENTKVTGVIQRIPILPLGASLVVCLLMWSPRSYGGDFWLHLWLINQQAESWRDSLLPSTLISFSPVGTLNTLPMFSGGLTYAIAGALVASGLSINGSVVLMVAALYGVTIWESQLTARSYGLSGLSVTAVSLVPAAFAWPIGDGFGRGGFSSFCAGMLSIALLLRTVRIESLLKLSLNRGDYYLLAATRPPSRRRIFRPGSDSTYYLACELLASWRCLLCSDALPNPDPTQLRPVK